jgi:hypothetical protein
MFGYTGQYFLPQTQLGITPAQFISEAQNLSSTVGRGNLTLISVVGEEPSQPINSTTPPAKLNVNWTNATQVAMLKNFVSSLSNYASGLCARLDFQEFNTTVYKQKSIFTEVSNFVKKLGVNCFWFDHAPNLYNIMGQNAFNHMMQQLYKTNHSVVYFMNDAVGCPATVKCPSGSAYPWITPLKNDTWQKQTYISPSVVAKSYEKLSPKTMLALDAIWMCSSCKTKGKGMILHWDAYSQVSTEPMGLFANQSSASEQSVLQTLTNEGMGPNYHYYVMYPILGAATYNGTLNGSSTNYQGTLYNSLSVGNFARGTSTQFATIMVKSQGP